jgi:hypothetical protein
LLKPLQGSTALEGVLDRQRIGYRAMLGHG